MFVPPVPRSPFSGFLHLAICSTRCNRINPGICCLRGSWIPGRRVIRARDVLVPASSAVAVPRCYILRGLCAVVFLCVGVWSWALSCDLDFLDLQGLSHPSYILFGHRSIPLRQGVGSCACRVSMQGGGGPSSLPTPISSGMPLGVCDAGWRMRIWPCDHAMQIQRCPI